MSIIPTRIQEQVNRVDRTRSLLIGIGTGLTALWAIYRVFWLIYSATVLSGVGISAPALLFSAVIWGAVGVAAGVVSAAFLLRYLRHI